MFQLHKETILYIFCPANGITGGPEALHQLCDAVNRQGGKAKMVYVDYGTESILTKGKPLPYRIYCTRNTDKIVDDDKNIAVVPEIWAHLLDGYHKIQKTLWWLSVNYLREERIFQDKDFLHLYQSVYAKDFLQSKSVEGIFPLYDYLNIPFKKVNLAGKRRQVCYNPKKGLEYTNQVIGKMEGAGIDFIALKGFSKKEMAVVLKNSKVYIDLGDHPGKDRIPREAAVAGNIILTSKKGSALFPEDVPIPDRYKFEVSDIDGICRAINEGMDDHSGNKADFSYYLRVIRQQKKEFFNQAAVLFVGENYSVARKYAAFAAYRVFPMRFFILNIELVVNKAVKNIPSSAKKKIRRLFSLNP